MALTSLSWGLHPHPWTQQLCLSLAPWAFSLELSLKEWWSPIKWQPCGGTSHPGLTPCLGLGCHLSVWACLVVVGPDRKSDLRSWLAPYCDIVLWSGSFLNLSLCSVCLAQVVGVGCGVPFLPAHLLWGSNPVLARNSGRTLAILCWHLPHL